ncbi:MAG: TrkA C-terminal domain-containing protein [bacterium]
MAEFFPIPESYQIAYNIAALFLIISIGYALGRIEIFGISLGLSAVLFVALVFGHFHLRTPQELTDLGVILFVYCIGLQAGPRFFATFRRRGIAFAQIGLVAIFSGAAVTGLLAWWFGLSGAEAAGVFAGALTSTPGLAAAQATLSDESVSVACGIAYPFGVVGVVLFVQIISRRSRKDKESAESPVAAKKDRERFHLPMKQYRVDNPQCEGKTLSQMDLHRMTSANISRVKHGDSVVPARPDTVLHVGDIVLAVGPLKELTKFEWLLGPETSTEMHSSKDVIARDVYVSENRVAGKTIAELQVGERFGVIISRHAREDIELVPTGESRLEIGDLIRIVGSPVNCETFIDFVGQHEKRIHEITILPFSMGIVLGVLLGYLPIDLPGGITARLGLAGGPLFVGLLLGYFGGFGRLRLHTPYAVRYLLSELGLVFFLAGAGTQAGAKFMVVFLQKGEILLLAGAIVTIVSTVSAYLLARYVFRLDLPVSVGAVCGGMTSTPGLGAARTGMESDEPALAYATVYPIALIAVTVAAQALSLLL